MYQFVPVAASAALACASMRVFEGLAQAMCRGKAAECCAQIRQNRRPANGWKHRMRPEPSSRSHKSIVALQGLFLHRRLMLYPAKAQTSAMLLFGSVGVAATSALCCMRTRAPRNCIVNGVSYRCLAFDNQFVNVAQLMNMLLQVRNTLHGRKQLKQQRLLQHQCSLWSGSRVPTSCCTTAD